MADWSVINSDNFLKLAIEVSAAINNRGHATRFARVQGWPDDKDALERDATKEFARSLRAAFGITLTAIKSRLPPTPDCSAICNGREISIELVELVDPKLLSCIATERRTTGRQISSHDELFSAAQWTPERLLAELSRHLDNKNCKRKTANQAADVLLIYTAEPWLELATVRAALHAHGFNKRPFLLSAFFMMSHFPGYGGDDPHWPIFNLFGDIQTD